MKFICLKTWYPCYEGEGDTTPPTDTPKTDPVVNDPPEDMFTQEQVNRFMKEQKDKLQSQSKAVIDELEGIKATAGLNESERKSLEERIISMKKQMLTKEELIKEEREKVEREKTEQVNALTEDRDSWKSKYDISTIKRAINDAAGTHKAFNPKQIEALLSPNTHLVEDTGEDGKVTGDYSPRVNFQTTDADGAPVMLDLSVAEAVKKMAEMSDYFNLFETAATSGLGTTNGQGFGDKVTDAVMLAQTNPEKYRKLRAEGKISVSEL